MTLLTRKRLLRAGLENPVGTFVPPSIDILARSIDVSPVEGTIVERDVILPHLDKLKHLRVGDYAQIKFQTELAGSGAAGTAPPWAPLLLGCGFSEVTKAVVSGNGQSSTNTTIALMTAAVGTLSSVDDYYVGRQITIPGNTARAITAYNGSTKTCTVYPPFETGTGGGTTYSISIAVEYTPISTFGDSTTVSLTYDVGSEASTDCGHFEFASCRGNVSLTLNKQQIPTLDFDFTGLIHSRSDGTMPTGDFSDWQDPLIPTDVHTPAIVVHGYTACVLGQFTLDMKNTVAYQQQINDQRIRLTARDPGGTLDYQALLIAEHDYWSAIQNNSVGNLIIQHGNTSGNIVTVVAPAMQIRDGKYQDADGIVHAQSSFSLRANSSAGNDSIKIVVQ